MQNMDLWTVLNSPVVITGITLLWGTFVASRVTALWQKRNHLYQLKAKYLSDIVQTYHQYIGFIKRADVSNDQAFDEVHSRIYAQAKLIGIVFDSETVGTQWLTICNKLANCRNLLVNGQSKTITAKLEEIFEYAEEVMAQMLEEF